MLATARTVSGDASRRGGETYREHVRPHPRDVLGVAVDPALRAEAVRVLAEDALVPVHDPAVDADDRVLGYELPVQHDAALGRTPLEDEACARVDAERLVCYREPTVGVALALKGDSHVDRERGTRRSHENGVGDQSDGGSSGSLHVAQTSDLGVLGGTGQVPRSDRVGDLLVELLLHSEILGEVIHHGPQCDRDDIMGGDTFGVISPPYNVGRVDRRDTLTRVLLTR